MTDFREGILLCLVGPAGSGKTSIGTSILNAFTALQLSVSVTSRAPREGEQEGVHYYFVSRETFEDKIKKKEFYEYEETHGNYYGTLRSTIEQAIRSGTDLLLDIDIRGALNLAEAFPNNAVVVFIVPPSVAVLKERLRNRGSMSEKEFETRMKTAHEEYEIVKQAIHNAQGVDYLIVNDDYAMAVALVSDILHAERNRAVRLKKEYVEDLCSLE